MLIPGQSLTKFKLETAALREKEELQAKWGEILHAAKAERVNLESRCSELRGKSTMMRERRGLQEQEVANIRAQLPSGAAGWVGVNSHHENVSFSWS